MSHLRVRRMIDHVVDTVRPLLDHLLEQPTPSIMASGLVVTYTEAAVQAGAPSDDRVAAVGHLGQVLEGDFNRLGLAPARLVQSDRDVAVQAVGACSRDGGSNFAARQIDAVLDAAREQSVRRASNNCSDLALPASATTSIAPCGRACNRPSTRSIDIPLSRDSGRSDGSQRANRLNWRRRSRLASIGGSPP